MSMEHGEADGSVEDELRQVNRRQRDYYESKFNSQEVAHAADIAAAGTATNLWAAARRRLILYNDAIGVETELLALHRAWLGDLSGRRVLDLGCYSGNPLSLELARVAGRYLALDLSPAAIAELRRKLDEAGLPEARAEAGDFLEADIPDGAFDVVYARSVLHHFRDPARVARELHRVLAPGGMVIAYDPLQTEPINRLARALYRPFQSDRDWEWPFTRATFAEFDRHFGIEAVQGWGGFSKLGLALALVPGMHAAGAGLGRLGWRLDRRLAAQRGPWLWLCWNVTMKLRRR